MDKAKKVVRRERKGFRGANAPKGALVNRNVLDLFNRISAARQLSSLEWATAATYIFIKEYYEETNLTATSYLVMKHVELGHSSYTLKNVQRRLTYLESIGLLSSYMVKLTKHYYPSTSVLSQTA